MSDALEADVVASAVVELMKGQRTEWSGTATDLLAALEAVVPMKVIRKRLTNPSVQ